MNGSKEYIVNTISSLVGSFCASFACFPLDVIKIRFQVQVDFILIKESSNGDYEDSQEIYIFL